MADKTTVTTPTHFSKTAPVSLEERRNNSRAKHSDIFMPVRDIKMTDLIKTANVVNKRPHRDTTRRRTGLYRDLGKRAMDVSLILLSLPAILPLLLVLTAIVALHGGQPIFRQERIGRDGRIFHMWKLRTMVPGADEALETYLDDNPAMRAEWATKQKLLDDPRVTSLGRFLRKSSIDELPQLYNVLRGDMSLVGPRPMMVDQQTLYPGHDYYEVRPGITGFWQISDRNETSFADRAFYDARYNNQLSLKTDLAILFGTIRVVLRGTGH